MYIEAVPNRGSPPAILLRESYREGGKVKKRTLLNLSDWSADRVAGFKMLLKGGTVIPQDQQAITITRSLPHGHVDALPISARRARSASIVCSAPTATVVAIWCWPLSSAACSSPVPSSPPPARCRRRPPAPASASSSALASLMRTSSTPHWTGWRFASRQS